MTRARDNSKFGDFAGNEVFLDSDKDTSITADTDDQIDIKVGGTDRMVIDSSGHVLVGTSNLGTIGSTDGISLYSNGVIGSSATSTRSVFSRRSSNGQVVLFRRDTTDVGNISVTTTSTAYNTSSDYRLKENVDYTFDATTRLKQLKPCRFNFIADESNTLVDGFIAHEVSSIVPEAVTGTKDEMETYTDDNGEEQTREKYQGIDQSKLVPLLVKTIQELEARITALENN